MINPGFGNKNGEREESMIEAILYNPKQADQKNVLVCFPITSYKDIYEKLDAAGMGNALERDCCVMEIIKGLPILKRLEETYVNVDELDYLAKRLDSFDEREIAKFQGAAVSCGCDSISDLINLTFSCQEVTIIQDFRDLKAIGRDHYMDIYGGATEEELKALDARKCALSLILNDTGSITPYGIIYENGMQLSQLYSGKQFPEYDYGCKSVLVVAMGKRSKSESGSSEDVTWFYLPMEKCQIERAMLRADISRCDDMQIKYIRSEFPAGLDTLLASNGLDLEPLNDLCIRFKALDESERKKTHGVLQMACPSDIFQVRNLIEQLGLFEFFPGISTPEEYGRHMIIESGHYDYDSELEEFYDFKKYGEQRIADECGMFTNQGYISYHGFLSIEEVMAGSNSERMIMTMGGM